jgi:hypothetical protein
MNDRPERDRLIELLDKLGDDADDEVLAAARRLHALVDETGADWDDLLAEPDEDAADEPDDADQEDDEADQEDDEAEDAEDEAPEGSARQGADMGDPESLKLIDGLLGRSDISEYLREELEGYKEDIGEGEFEASDRAYLRALHGRLKKGR